MSKSKGELGTGLGWWSGESWKGLLRRSVSQEKSPQPVNFGSNVEEKIS